MKRLSESVTLLSLMLMTMLGCRKSISQAPGIALNNATLQAKLTTLLKHDVPVMSVQTAFEQRQDLVFIDTRSQEEYDVSHLPDAQFVDYDRVKDAELAEWPMDKTLVFYCSVGYRSERIVRRMQKLGYDRVYNLYGSLFEWAERDYPLENTAGQSVKDVHTYNRTWSKYIDHPEIKEIY